MIVAMLVTAIGTFLIIYYSWRRVLNRHPQESKVFMTTNSVHPEEGWYEVFLGLNDDTKLCERRSLPPYSYNNNERDFIGSDNEMEVLYMELRKEMLNDYFNPPYKQSAGLGNRDISETEFNQIINNRNK